MINRKLSKNRIVYVIPPSYMKFLKRRSTSSRCPSNLNTPFEPSPKHVDPNKSGISDWKWPFRRSAESVSRTDVAAETNQQSRVAVTTPFYQTTPTTISSQVPTTVLPFTQLTTPFSSKTTTTVTSMPATSTTTATTKKMSAIFQPLSTASSTKTTTTTKRVSTIFEPLRTDKPISPRGTDITPMFYPTSAISPTETKSTSTSSSTRISSSPTRTKYTLSTTPLEMKSSPRTETSSSTCRITESAKVTDKCLEWYNKIKDGDRCDSEGGNCTKWFNLIRDNDDKQISTRLKKSSGRKNPPDTRLNPSSLNRVDKYLDTRTGNEYLEPIIQSPILSQVLDNPFMEFITNRPSSNKKGARTDVFSLTIEDRIRTLKWLNQQILQRYGMLSKIDKITRANRLFAGNASNVKMMSSKILVNNFTRKTTRAQRLRDEFIRKKIQRVGLDTNDGWWKNFNAKSYRKNSGNNFLNSSLQDVE